MSNTDDVRALIEASLKQKVLEAFNETPELIDKMMEVALVDHKVDGSGNPPRYGSGKMPYIDFVIGQQIRVAAQAATREVIGEQMPALKAQIAKRLSGGEFADAAVTAMLDKLADDWRIKVEFSRADET